MKNKWRTVFSAHLRNGLGNGVGDEVYNQVGLTIDEQQIRAENSVGHFVRKPGELSQ
jgi:hypothetical protein